MEYQIYGDGGIDLRCGEMGLIGGYPAIDGRAVRPVRVAAFDGGARFELADGSIDVRFAADGDGIRIRCRVEGCVGAHDVSPFAHATVVGCDRIFRQGLGMGGPSGFAPLSGSEAMASDAVVAVGNGDACLTMHAVDHRRFRSRFALAGGRLSAAFDLEGVMSGGELPDLIVRPGADFSGALHACALDIARFMGARTPQKPAFHWCSWYYLYHTLDQATLEDYLSGFQPLREVAPFSHIQVDAGYFPSCGDWLEANGRFPDGLKGAAQAILRAGYQPGVWVGPFMVGDNSRLFREHPDWMLRNRDGGYVTPWVQYNEPKPWGYRDSDYFVLDTSHPDAMAYLARVFKALRGYGYTLFKTDFLFWGLQDSSKVVRHTPGKTSFEYFRDAMRTIRDAIGEDAAWLGCIAPFMPAVGFVDMMRIGGDVGAQWEESGFGPVNMIRELVADQYFNNVYWQNDPDAVLLRDFHIHLKPRQVEALALLQAMSGGVVDTSDPIHLIAPDRLALLNLIRPSALANPQYPYWHFGRDEVVVVQRLPQGGLVLLFNPTNRDVTAQYDWRALLGGGNWHLRRLHGDSTPCDAVPAVTTPARGCALFFASREPLAEEPKNLWDW